MIPVYVWPTKKVSGCASVVDGRMVDKDGRPVQEFVPVDLVAALQAQYSTDAHFVPYALVGADGQARRAPRTNQAAWSKVEELHASRLVIQCLPLDFDDPVAHAKNDGTPASDEWRADWHARTVPLVVGILGAPVIWYETRGGGRCIAVLPTPLTAPEYLELMSGVVEAATRIGVELDKLKDVQRCYRLPYVSRDGKLDRRPASIAPVPPVPASAIDTLRQLGREHPMKTPFVPPPPPPGLPLRMPGDSLIATFNETRSWSDVLTPAGWTFVGMEGAQECWNRPGKDGKSGESASARTNYKESGKLFVWSDKAGIDHDRNYDKFGIFYRSEGLTYEAGVQRIRDILLSEGYLEPYVDRLADPDLIDLVRGGELARQDWEAVRAAAPKGEKAKGEKAKGEKAKAERPRHFDGAHEVRFESDSDVTLAIALCQELEAGLEAPVVGCEGTLWQYRAPVWEPMKPFQIENHVARWEGSPVMSMKGEPMPLRLNNTKIKNVTERARTERADPDFFRDVTGAVAFKNGMAAIRDGQVVLEPPSPDHRVKHVLDLEYTEREPTHFFDFLGSCFEGADDAPQRAIYLSEFVGACLAGVATRFEVATILLGGGANGKSTFLNHAVRPIFPRSAITAVSPQDMGREYNRASLVTSAVNIVSEMPDGEILGAEVVKAIISGEAVQARQIREAPFDLHCRAGHIFAANDLPSLRDFSAGFKRRWRIITFPNSFDVGSEKRRIDLPDLLRSERSEIASWYIRCAAKAIERGEYTAVTSSDTEVFRWVNEADSVAVWIESRCQRSAVLTSSGKLYGDYRNWVGTVGMKPVTIQKWGRRLTRLGVSSHHSNEGNKRGLVLNHDRDAAF